MFTDDENMIEILLIFLGWGIVTIYVFPMILSLLRVKLSSQIMYLNIMCIVPILVKLATYILLSAVEWETEMTDLSANDCWDYFSTTFNEILAIHIP